MSIAEKPYNELPLLPPKINIGESIYKKIISANKVLAELKGMSQLLPNPAIMINSLILIEAQDSSEIENIVTTQDALYKASSSSAEVNDPSIKEVLNYREALWLGYNTLKENNLLTIKTILKIQERLLKNDAGIRTQIGTALRNSRTGKVIYTPPVGKEVIEDKLSNLERYINDETMHDIDPLIKLAIQHYQFESIHPFYDGNGRTGRIINVLYLIQQDLIQLPIIYLSSYIIQNKQDYYRGLQEVRTKGDWKSWIEFILDSVEFTARATIQMIKQIKELEDSVKQRVKSTLPKIYSRELIDVIFKQPYVRISNLEKELNITRFTSSKYLQELSRIDILESEKIGRDIVYINTDLVKLLKRR